MSNPYLGAIGTNPPRHQRIPFTISNSTRVIGCIAVFVVGALLWLQYSYGKDIYLAANRTPVEQSSPGAAPMMAPTAPIPGLQRAP